VVQAEGASLGAQHTPRALPAQRPRGRHFWQQLVAESAQRGDPPAGRHAGVVGEGDVYPLRGELRCHGLDIGHRHVHDHTYLALRGRDADERMHVQDLVRQRADLVGGHHPRAQPEQQAQPHRERHQPQPPERDRPHAPRRLQHHVDGRGMEG